MPVVFLAVLGMTVVGCGVHRSQGGSAGGRLYVVLGGNPTSRDPVAAFDELSDAVLVNVFQSVLAPAAPDAYSACVSWTNPDPRTWDLQVRRGLHFHDGRELEAEDVAASIRTVMEDENSALRRFLSEVEAVRVLGPYRVRLRTRNPSNLITGLSFVPVLPGGRRPGRTELPVGSGPYRVVEWEEGQKIVLERFSEAHAGGGSGPHQVCLLPAPTAEAQLRLLTRLEPVLGTVLVRAARDRAPSEGLRVLTAPGKAQWYLVCNLRAGHPTAAREVRLALAASVDVHALARELDIPDLPADDVLPPGVVGWRRGRYHPNPAWNSGKRPAVPLRFVVMETVRPAAEELTRQFRHGGWKVRLTVLPVKRVLAGFDGDDWDLSLLGFTCASGDAMEFYEFAFSSGVSGAAGNFSGFQDPMVTQRIETARRALDPEVRLRALQAVGDGLVRELPWIPLVAIDRWAVLRGRVRAPGGLPPRLWLTRLEVGP